MNPVTITYLILIGAVILLLSDRIRSDLVALMVIVALGVSGVLTPAEAYSGFSRSAVITIIAVFILAEALSVTGITDQIGSFLVHLVGQKEGWLATTIMTAAAFLSLLMNNIAAVAVLLPSVAVASHKTKISPSRLLMPLAFGALLGGMATLFTTANILVSSLLRDAGYQGYSVLEFLPLGIPLVITGILYMVLLGRRWLPVTTPTQRLIEQSGPELVSIYRLEERLIRARLTLGSELAGKTIAQSCLRECHNLNLVAIERNGRSLLSLSPDLVILPDDILVLEARPEDLNSPNLSGLFEVISIGDLDQRAFEDRKIAIVEAVLSPRSTLINTTLRDSHFREKYRMIVLAIWRAGRPIRTRFSDLPLQFGDALLLQGDAAQISVLKAEPDFIVLGSDVQAARLNRRKALPAILVMAVTLLAAILWPDHIGEVMLCGAVLMLLIGVLSMDQAYRAIEWKSVFLVAGMLPLGLAMTKTGAANQLAELVLQVLGNAGPMLILAGLVILTVLLVQVINGAAVATIMAPVAIGVAQQLGADPRAFAMGIALATSFAFLTPFGHPVNVLVMGSAGYRVRDFTRVGLPMTMILLVLIFSLMPFFWPLFPTH
jgi:di/tricarboxylate transporter